MKKESNRSKIWEEGKKYSAPLPEKEDIKGIPPQAPLLDIGCGYGRLLFHLHSLGFRNLFGVDFVFSPLKKINFARVVQGRAESLPFKNQSFASAFLVGVLSSILEDRLRERVFQEASRVLFKKGRLFLSAFGINRFYKEKYEKGLREFGKYGVFRSSHGGVFRHASEEELKQLLIKANFKILKMERRPFTTMHGNRAEGFTVLAERT